MRSEVLIDTKIAFAETFDSLALVGVNNALFRTEVVLYSVGFEWNLTNITIQRRLTY